MATTGVGTATNYLSIWNGIVGDVVKERQLSLVEAARVFVLVNVSVHDGLLLEHNFVAERNSVLRHFDNLPIFDDDRVFLRHSGASRQLRVLG